MDAELAQGRRLRAVGEMVGGIAHEFNNLLTPIVLKVELLREERDADRTLQRELDVIAGAADRAATLTTAPADLRPEGRARACARASVGIVAANVELVLPTCDPRIALVVDVPPQMPALFQNPADLHQVVLNLLMNARDTLHDKLERDAAAEARITVRVEPLAPANGRGPATASGSASPTPAWACRARCSSASSSRFSPPRKSAGDRAWAGHGLAPGADLRGPCRGGFDARARARPFGSICRGKSRPISPRPNPEPIGPRPAHSQERPS